MQPRVIIRRLALRASRKMDEFSSGRPPSRHSRTRSKKPINSEPSSPETTGKWARGKISHPAIVLITHAVLCTRNGETSATIIGELMHCIAPHFRMHPPEKT